MKLILISKEILSLFINLKQLLDKSQGKNTIKVVIKPNFIQNLFKVFFLFDQLKI